jgi:PAS domain S-box-containing protein
MTGYTEEEVKGITAEEALERVHPDDRHVPIEQQKLAAAGANSTEPVEYRWKVTSGQYRWFSDQRRLVRDEHGKPVALVGISRDITDIKRVQKELADSEHIYRSIGELIPFGVWTTDAAGQATYISPSFCELVGKTEEEILRFGWLETLDPETLERTISEWKRTIATGGFWNRTHKVMGIDGQYHYVLARGAPIKDEEGAILGWGGVNIDLTEQKRNEENLARSNAELQQFVYVASHDLQEPLRSVVSYLSLLDRRYGNELSQQGKEYLKFALEGGARMRMLIDDLLDYSRVDTNGKEFACVDMNALVADTITLLKGPIEEVKAEIVIDPLPTVMADRSQIIQVMQNLLTNAIKFHGPEQPKIRISATPGSREWIFSVRDNGIGLDTVYVTKIFQMFQRLHTRDKYPGTGVGLAISKKIVERHGGRIWVESEEGKGATFFFTLPTVAKKP